MNNRLARQSQPIYEIRIRGRIEDRWADWFENLAFNHEEDGTTTLRGPLEDQTALHGVLNHIKNLNLPLIYVRTIDEEENMNKYQGTINLILKAVALGMGAAVVVLGILGVATTETSITLLGIGLFALALTALQGTN